MQIIDSHQHFWTYDPIHFNWIDHSMSALKQNFLPPDLEEIYKENGIHGCVSVQASSTEDETKTLLAHADKFDFIKGVVGWVDLQAANAHERLLVYKGNPKFKGVRHVLQSEPDEFMEQADFIRGISYLADLGLTYDILIYPRHLFYAYKLASKFPNQKFIIDHLAKPLIKYKNFNDWSALMNNFKEMPNVHCKVSGMVTEADWKHWGYKDFLQPLDKVTEIFGPERMLYGSDWPVCLLAASYKNVLDIIKTYTDKWSQNEKAKIFYENAIQFYNLVP